MNESLKELKFSQKYNSVVSSLENDLIEIDKKSAATGKFFSGSLYNIRRDKCFESVKNIVNFKTTLEIEEIKRNAQNINPDDIEKYLATCIELIEKLKENLLIPSIINWIKRLSLPQTNIDSIFQQFNSDFEKFKSEILLDNKVLLTELHIIQNQPINKNTILNPQKESDCVIFISHSVKDKNIADKLLDLLLVTDIGITSKSVFCSSLEGTGIPEGQNFIDYIKQQIQKPELVIILLTPHYYDSIFCLCELGASWALSLNIFPLIVPPLKLDDLKAVLTTIQSGLLNDTNTLNNLKDRIVKLTVAPDANTTRWEIKRNEFMTKINEILLKQEYKLKVDYVKFEEQCKINEQLIQKIKEKDEYILSLKQKDVKILTPSPNTNSTSVQSFESVLDNELSDFEIIIDEINNSFRNLSTLVINGLYDDYKGDNIFINTFDSNTNFYLSEAVDNKFFLHDEDEGSFSINSSDPTMRTCQKILEKLNTFLNDASCDFLKYYVQKYNFKPELNNKRFWKNHFKNF